MWNNLLWGGGANAHLSASHLTPLPFQLQTILSSAQFGDLIEFSYPIGYSHWAVYDEDGHVIHFAVAGTERTSVNVQVL